MATAGASRISAHCSMSDPRNWMIFRSVKSDLVDRIRLFYVFGVDGREAIFVTDDDDVYRMDRNRVDPDEIDPHMVVPSPLPPHSEATLWQGRPFLVPELSKKRAVKFVHGANATEESCVLLVVTDRGRVFDYSSFLPTQVGGLLERVVVVDVAIARQRCVALTDNGELYVWNASEVQEVAKVNIQGYHQAFTLIAGGCNTIWALQGYRSLYACNAESSEFVFASDHETTIVHIACSQSHCVALTSEWDIKIWTECWSDDGDWGFSVKLNVSQCSIGNVVEVAATSARHLSAALTRDGIVYVWGQNVAEPTAPLVSPFTSLQEAFCFYAQPSITYRPVTVADGATAAVGRSLRSSFDDQTTSDFTFTVDGKAIHVHKLILQIRSGYFKRMFSGPWIENSRDTVEVKVYSFDVFRAFLKYLYTDEVHVDGLTNLIALLDLAQFYCEDALKKHCETHLKRLVTVENVADIYGAAIKFDVVGLREFSLDFAGRHFREIVKKKAYGSLADDTLKDFFAEAFERGEFKQYLEGKYQ